MTIDKLIRRIESEQPRSAWGRGVKVYALELAEELAEGVAGGYVRSDVLASPKLLAKALLNGADNWSEYSFGGCALMYDEDIAKRLSTPSDLKRKRGGELPPNEREEWLDVQAQALHQAARLIQRLAREGNTC